jgi:hypothetical protein
MIIKKFLEIKTQEDIPNFLIETNLNNNICELGVFSGGGIKNLLKSNPKFIVGIDIWEDNNHLPTTDSMTQTQMDQNYKDNYSKNYL